ncbi:MAG: hypothetical protein K9I85_01660 [Saprospiraceae bacterium]|nr:hypothetical protein [Saprospiraceae bacterium]
MKHPIRSFLVFSLLMAMLTLGLLWSLLPALSLLEGMLQFGFFFVLTSTILITASRTVHHPNPFLFHGLILGSVLGKLILSLIFLFAYTRLITPSGRSFLILFFCLYIGYTIYEIKVMIKLSRTQQASLRQ